MFDTQENRYITRGVNEIIPKKIQLCCWQMIDEKARQPEIQLDYLQIFEFIRNTQKGIFTIIHRQEEPPFIDYHEWQLTEELRSFSVTKLWIIDERTHQTLLLPDEY